MITSKRVYFLFLLTLLAGMVAGAAVMQIYIQTRLRVYMRGEQERYHDYFLRRLHTELNLSDTQYTQIRTIIMANQEQLTRLRQRTQPEVEQLATEANVKIAQQLTPEQTARFKDFLVRFPEPGLRGLTPHSSTTPAHP